MKSSDDSGNRKDFRRKHIKNKSLDRQHYDETQKDIGKIKKEFKHKKLDLDQEEVWEDWKDFYK